MLRFLLRILLSGFTGCLIGVFLYVGENTYFPNFQDNVSLYLISIVTGVITGQGLTFAEYPLNWLFKTTQNATLRLSVSIPVHVILCLLVVFVFLRIVIVFIAPELSMSIIFQLYEDATKKLVLLLGIVGFIYSLVDFTMFSYNMYAIGQIENLKVQRRQLELQFEALKSQLSPHYLFNSLNTISSLAEQDSQHAEDFIRKLAQTYQYILGTRSKRLVSVAEEVDFLKAYHFLLQVRFEDALKLSFNLPEAVLQTSIPPLTLQMLLENAVKHNVISEEMPVSVKIFQDEKGFLVVSNNITEEPSLTQSLQVGLNNIT